MFLGRRGGTPTAKTTPATTPQRGSQHTPAGAPPVLSGGGANPVGRQMFERTRQLLDEAKALVSLGVDPAPEFTQIQRELEQLRAHVFALTDVRQRDAARQALAHLVADVRQLQSVGLQQQRPPAATPPNTEQKNDSTLFDGLSLTPSPAPAAPSTPVHTSLFSGLSLSPQELPTQGAPATREQAPLPAGPSLFDGLNVSDSPTLLPTVTAVAPATALFTERMVPAPVLAMFDTSYTFEEVPSPSTRGFSDAAPDILDKMQSEPALMKASPLPPPPPPPPSPSIVPAAVVPSPVLTSLAPVPPLPLSVARPVQTPGTASHDSITQRLDAVMQRASSDAVRASMMTHHDAETRYLAAQAVLTQLVSQQEELCARDDFAGAEALQDPIAVAQRDADISRDARAVAEEQLLSAEWEFALALESTLPQCVQEVAAIEASVTRQPLEGFKSADIAEQMLQQAEEQLRALDVKHAQVLAPLTQQLDACRADHARVTAEHASMSKEVDALRAQLAAAEARLSRLTDELDVAAQRVHDADAETAAAQTAAKQAMLAAQQHVSMLQQSAANNAGALRMLSHAKEDLMHRQQVLPARKQAISSRFGLFKMVQSAQAALSHAMQDRMSAERALQEASAAVGQTQQALVVSEERCAAANRQLAIFDERKRNAVLAKDFKAAAATAADAKAAAMQRDSCSNEVLTLKAQLSAASSAFASAADLVKATSARLQNCSVAVTTARLDMLRADTAAAEEALQAAVAGDQFDDAHVLQLRLDALRREMLDLQRQAVNC